MRAVVSTIGSPSCGSSYDTRVLNSSSFVEEAKKWNISRNEIQTSFDVVNVYPSAPINEAVAVIIE